MSENTEPKGNLLEQIIEKGMDIVKKPFIKKRVTRAFESAKDSIEEQLMDKEAAINAAREAMVDTAKSGDNLKIHVQKLITLRGEIRELKAAQGDLETEKADLLS